MDWITAVITIIDWTITQAEASGESVPQDVLDARTALRRDIMRDADREASHDTDRD